MTGPVYWVPNIPDTYSYGTFQTNRPDYSTRYNGVEFQLTKRLSNKWMAHGSVTWNSWKEKVSNVAKGCVDPTNQVASFQGYFWAGPSQANGSNSCASGDIAYDYNFNISGSVFGHQGYLTPYYVVDAPPDGLGNRFIAAGKADAHRLASVYEADLSVQKVIPLAGKADVTLSINMFNVFNTKTTLFRESDATDDGTMHGSAGFADNQQNPRVLSFGARVSF